LELCPSAAGYALFAINPFLSPYCRMMLLVK